MLPFGQARRSTAATSRSLRAAARRAESSAPPGASPAGTPPRELSSRAAPPTRRSETARAHSSASRGSSRGDVVDEHPLEKIADDAEVVAALGDLLAQQHVGVGIAARASSPLSAEPNSASAFCAVRPSNASRSARSTSSARLLSRRNGNSRKPASAYRCRMSHVQKKKKWSTPMMSSTVSRRWYNASKSTPRASSRCICR